MPIRAKIKFRGDLPLRIEMNLVHKFGFTVYSRLKGQYVIFLKMNYGDKKKIIDGYDFTEMSEVKRVELTKRCVRIVAWYEDPSKHIKQIHLRLNYATNELPPIERAFMLHWLHTNYPLPVNEGPVIAL